VMSSCARRARKIRRVKNPRRRRGGF
jgi:hypothetical protein